MANSEPSSLSLVTESKGRRADEALLFVDEQLTERESSIIKGVLKVLEGSEALDPTLAVEKWIALGEIRRLRQMLQGIAKRGHNAARRNAEHRPDIG